MASSLTKENDEILEILDKREGAFEKTFKRLDKKEGNGYLTPKQLKDFWTKREYSMEIYGSLTESFELDDKDKKISLDGNLLKKKSWKSSSIIVFCY